MNTAQIISRMAALAVLTGLWALSLTLLGLFARATWEVLRFGWSLI